MNTIVYHTSEHDILVAPMRPTRADWLAVSRVKPDTYASDLIDRLYDTLCTSTVDLRDEFDRYYKIEYAELSRMLYEKYGFPRALLGDLSLAIERGDFIGLIEDACSRNWEVYRLVQDRYEYGDDGATARQLMEAVGVQWIDYEEADNED